MDGEAVTSSDFHRPLLPIVTPAAIPAPDVAWSDPDWQVIRTGHRSRDVDDRWHAYVEDDRLFLHRSWTGHGIFTARFVRAGDVWRVAAAEVESDPSHYRRGSDDYESLLLVQLVDGVLLDRWDPALRDRLHALRRA